jgi:hypothetical protein
MQNFMQKKFTKVNISFDKKNSHPDAEKETELSKNETKKISMIINLKKKNLKIETYLSDTNRLSIRTPMKAEHFFKEDKRPISSIKFNLDINDINNINTQTPFRKLKWLDSVTNSTKIKPMDFSVSNKKNLLTEFNLNENFTSPFLLSTSNIETLDIIPASPSMTKKQFTSINFS